MNGHVAKVLGFVEGEWSDRAAAAHEFGFGMRGQCERQPGQRWGEQ